MSNTFKIDDKEYKFEELSPAGLETFNALKFTTVRINEIQNMLAILARAKNSYMEELKREVVSNKSGILFEEN